MLETVELPAGVANLDSGLTNVDAEALSHDDNEIVWVKCPPVTCSISPATELSSDVGAGDCSQAVCRRRRVRSERGEKVEINHLGEVLQLPESVTQAMTTSV